MTDQENSVQQTVIDKPGSRLIRWLTGIVLMSLVIVASGGYWLFNTAPGLKQLLATVERLSDETVRFEDVEGTATAMRMGQLHYQDESTQLTIRQLEMNWSLRQLLDRKLLIHAVNIQAIDIYSQPSDDETTLPDDLSLPVDLVIEHLHIGTLQFFTIDDESSEPRQPDFALTDLSARLKTDSHQHRINQLAFNSSFGALKASGQIETTQPFSLKASLHLDDSEQWGTTHVAVTGTLEKMDVKLRHRNLPLQGFIDAQLQPFAPSSLGMIKSLNGVIGGFNPVDFFPEASQANISMQLKLDPKPKPDSLGESLQGFLRLKNSIAASLDQEGLPLATLQTKVVLSEEVFKLNHLDIQLAGKGRVSGNASWQFGRTFDRAYAQADLVVNNLNPAAIDTQLQAANISGNIHLTGDADQQQFNVKLSDQTLKLDATAIHGANRIVLEKLSLRHGKSNLTGSGELNLADENAVGETQSFHFTGQLNQFNIADFIQGHESNLNLKLAIKGNLSPELSATLDYQFEQSHLNHQPVNGKGKVEFTQPMAIATQTDLQIGSNNLTAHGKFGNPGDTLSLHIVAPVLAQTGLGMSGALNAQIGLRGTLDKPAIDFEIHGKQLGLPGDRVIGSLNAVGRLDEETVALKMTVNQLSEAGKTQVKQFDLDIDGKIQQQSIRAGLNIDDEQTVSLLANGGLFGLSQAKKTPEWQGMLSELIITGQMPVQLLSPASVILGSDRATIDQVQLAVAGGTATIDKTFWSPESWHSTGHFSAIGLHPGGDLIPKENILQLGGKWSIQSKDSLDGEIEIFREKGDWYLPGDLPYAIGINTLKLHIQAGDGQLTGRFNLVSEHIGEANAKIALPIAHSRTNDFFPPNSPLNGELNLKTPDLSWLDHLIDGTLQSGGELELQARITGTLEKPAIQGNIAGEELAFALPDQGLNLDQGQFAAHFDRAALHIDRLHFMSPQEAPPKDRLLQKLELDSKPGSVDITGSLGFTENEHQLNIALDHVYLVHPPHYWIVASGTGTAKMFNNVLDFDGDITANAGLITQPPATRPELAGDIVFKDDETGSQRELDDDGSSTIVNLHANLDLGKQFFLRVAGLEGRLDGSLLIQNDEKGALSAVGSIATHSTTYKAYGQNLTVERGIVNFHGPLDDPGLNIRAVRKGLEVEAGVEVAGTVRHPKIKLVSSPNVPDTEKLSWIVLGRLPDASGLDTSLLVTAASSIMGGQSGFGVTDRIRDLFGFDELTFRQGSPTGSAGSQAARTGLQSSPFSNPYALASSTLGGQIGTIGKRISSRAYLSYERGITAATAGITKLTYSLTPSITVVTQAGEDSAVDLFYTFRFD